MTEQFAATRQEQRLFTVCSYQANTWDRSRTGVIKAECHAAGTNRRAVVTNRLGATILPQGVYDEYVQRGESENRNKELKIDLCGERLSDHRFVANLFRLLMHATALNLIIRLRRRIVAVLHAPMPNVPARPPVLNSVVLNRRRGVYG
ncbi:MAG: transposase [Planctomycetaceae bacterium]|nr:transposase [Planctomycetaceae bacterium]